MIRHPRPDQHRRGVPAACIVTDEQEVAGKLAPAHSDGRNWNVGARSVRVPASMRRSAGWHPLQAFAARIRRVSGSKLVSPVRMYAAS